MARPKQQWRGWSESDYDKLRKRRARARLNPDAHENRKVDRNYKPPDWVLAERERSLSCGPQSLTAIICGDPLPGRSALDQEFLECLLAAE